MKTKHKELLAVITLYATVAAIVVMMVFVSVRIVELETEQARRCEATGGKMENVHKSMECVIQRNNR
jgi:hypothetical protein